MRPPQLTPDGIRREVLAALQSGALCTFRDWPNPAVLRLAAGIYTVWRGVELIYVGMAGRGLTAEHIHAGQGSGRIGGLFSRLNSHASGRRSGDQFCLYVCDRFVLPTLSPEQIQAIAAGNLSLDRLTRDYIREHLTYRFAEAPDGREALQLETAVRRGGLAVGVPFLNPLP